MGNQIEVDVACAGWYYPFPSSGSCYTNESMAGTICRHEGRCRVIGIAMTGWMRPMLVTAFVVLVGCGNLRPPYDAGAPDTRMPSYSFDAQINLDATPRRTMCGGTVTASGRAPRGPVVEPRPFSASYVYATYNWGDGCDDITLTIADDAFEDGTSLAFALAPDPNTDSYVGTTTPTAYVAAGPGTYRTVEGSIVEITEFVPPSFVDSGVAHVVGTSKINADGVSVSGTFETPICDVNYCI